MMRVRAQRPVAAFVLALSLGAGSAYADKPARPAPSAPPSPERLRSAAQEFDEGRRLFQEKQYSEAAAHFENAFHDAPSTGAIRAAVRARVEAKEEARAATLAALALSTMEADAQTSKYFTQVVEGARPKLLELVLTCEVACEIAIDGKLVSLEPSTSFSIFVLPGAHRGAASFVGRTASATEFEVDGAQGQSRSLALEPKPEPAPRPREAGGEPEGGGTRNGPTQPTEARKPLPKALFFTGLGLTVAAGATTVVSGILTLSTPGEDRVRKDCAGLDTSCTTYQDGKGAELRTNIFLGVTIGLAVVTTAIAFFTDFKGKPANSRVTASTSVLTASALGLGGRGFAF